MGWRQWLTTGLGRRRARRWLAALLILLVAAAWGVWRRDRPVAYLSETVRRLDVERSVLATGTLQPIRKVDVGAQVSGQLKRLHVKLGERVTAGRLLAEIDPQLALHDLKIANADLAALAAERHGADERLWLATRELARQQALVAGDASSQRELERARAEMQRARAERDGIAARQRKARHVIEQQRTRLAYTRIAAPMTGEVLKIDTREGQTVIAAQQAPTILTLGDLSRMEVQAQVSEADILHIRPGAPAYFTLLGAAGRHRGRVREVQPTPQRLNNAVFYNVLFEVDNPARTLRTDMTAQVTIVLASAPSALAIPLTALGPRLADGRHPVRVLAPDGTIATRRVRTGVTGRTHAQVLEGLSAGERVVTGADDEPSAQQEPTHA